MSILTDDVYKGFINSELKEHIIENLEEISTLLHIDFRAPDATVDAAAGDKHDHNSLKFIVRLRDMAYTHKHELSFAFKEALQKQDEAAIAMLLPSYGSSHTAVTIADFLKNNANIILKAKGMPEIEISKIKTSTAASALRRKFPLDKLEDLYQEISYFIRLNIPVKEVFSSTTYETKLFLKAIEIIDKNK